MDVLGPSSPAAPTDGTVGAAGNLSRPYSWGSFVGAAQSPAAPTDGARINSSHPLLPPRDIFFYTKKGWEALGSS